MCYDATTSIGTFLFVGGMSWVLWCRNRPSDRAIALILLVISFMQLVEFVIWTHLGPTPENIVATQLIPLLLYAQPLLIAFIVWIFQAGVYPESYKWITYGLAAGLPFFIGNLSAVLENPPYTTIGPNGHLEWGVCRSSPLLYIYYTLLAYLFLTLKNATMGIVLLGGYLLSWMYYKRYYDREWSSMWCHAVNGAAVVALFSFP
jgi:hypothetical protein